MQTILVLVLVSGLDYSAGREDAAPRVAIDYGAGRTPSPSLPLSPSSPRVAPKTPPRPAASASATYVARSYEWHLVRGENRPNLIAHLATPQPEHHGAYFDRGWLSALSMHELVGLHSDAHNGRVQWQYVHRPAASKSQASSDPKETKRIEKAVGREVYGTRDGKHPGPLGSAIRNFFGDPRYSTSRQYSTGCPNGKKCPYRKS